MTYKVLILHKWLIVGGVERILLFYLSILEKLGYQIDLLITYESENASWKEHNVKYIFRKDYLKNIDIIKDKKKKSIFQKIKYEFFKTREQILFKKFINNQIKSNQYDLIIDFSQVLDKYIRENGNLISKKNITTIRWIHNQIPSSSKRDILKHNLIFSNHTAVIAICSEMKRIIKEQTQYKHNNIFVLYNPIDINLIKRKSEENINFQFSQEKYFLQVSRLVNGKGHIELLEIYKTIRNKGITHKLYLIGDGENKTFLRNKIKELGLENDCVLLGEISNPYPFFKNATLFLHTSESEGLPTVLLESMVCGTPVVAMDCPTGPKEILGENSEYGKLIPMHNKEAFTEAVIELLDDNEKYQYYCKKSIQRSLDFSSEKISEQVQQLFTEIIKKHKS
ncbi:glycosyltransferase [Glaesserella parasuis]|uniref:glycosyltransferase n=1 Tax=Glaesserella parasuis TaxID=738 RepID=UPI00274C9F48|nr:glycosyltransferase [Glaesserella parasuis]